MIIEVTGPIASGKTTLVKNLDRNDIIKSREMNKKKKVNYIKYMTSSKFFRKNFFLILRVSWLTKRNTLHALSEIVHYLFHAEKFDRENKLALWEEGIVCNFLVPKKGKDRKLVNKLRKRIVKRFPSAVIYVTCTDQKIRKKRIEKRSDPNGKHLLDADNPLEEIKKHYNRIEREVKTSVEPIKEEIEDVKEIKNETEFDNVLEKFDKVVQEIKENAEEKELI